MKKYLVAIFCVSFLGAVAVHAADSECPGSRLFTGAIEQIKTGNCAGQWGVSFSEGIIVPNNLPAEFEHEGYGVWGCYVVDSQKQACSISGKKSAAVTLKKIVPSYED